MFRKTVKGSRGPARRTRWGEGLSVSNPLSRSGAATRASGAAASIAARLEGRIRARIQHLPVDEEVGELCAEHGEFRIAVERVRNALKGVKFYGHACVLKLLDETFAALDRNRCVFHPMKDRDRRVSRSNV